jgi:hypothetical protein
MRSYKFRYILASRLFLESWKRSAQSSRETDQPAMVRLELRLSVYQISKDVQPDSLGVI